MKPKFLMAGIIVVALVAIGSFRLFQITGSATSAEGNQEVKVIIDYGSRVSEYSVLLAPGETAFDALKRVATPDYRMQLPSVIITEINGTRQDDTHQWACLVNDKKPETGCDYYYPASGDVIKFRYVNVG